MFQQPRDESGQFASYPWFIRALIFIIRTPYMWALVGIALVGGPYFFPTDFLEFVFAPLATACMSVGILLWTALAIRLMWAVATTDRDPGRVISKTLGLR